MSDRDCQCGSCVNACRLQPGWFVPGEAEKVAAFLGISFDEFKNKLAIDHCSAPWASDAPYVYAPKKVGVDPDGPAQIRTYRRQHQSSPCVFFIDDKCSIHQVKPFECRKVLTCESHPNYRDGIETQWIDAGAPLGIRPDRNDEDPL